MKKSVSLLLTILLLLSARASAAVAVNGLCTALIGEDGRVIVAPGKYEQIVRVADGLFAASGREGGYRLIDEMGNELTEGGYTYFEATAENILFEKENRCGVMNRALEIIVPCEYTCIVENGAGGFLALRSDIWDDYPDGVYRIDPDGRVTPTGVKIASVLSPFSDGLSPALSTDKGRYGYLNPQGQWGISPQFAYADEFAGGLARATLDSGVGVIDAKGAWKVSPKYDYLLRTGRDANKILGFQYGKSVDVYNANNLRLVYSYAAATEYAYFAADTTCLVVYEPENTGVFDGNGKEILSSASIALVSGCGENYLIISEGAFGDQSVYCVDMSGQTVTGPYQDIALLDEREGTARLIVRRFALGGMGDWDVSSIRCGVVDTGGNEILPMEYSDIISPAEGWILAEKDGLIELYNPEGALVWNYKL